MNEKLEPPSDVDFARIERQLFDRIHTRFRRQVVRHRLAAAALLLVLGGAGVAAGTIANPTQQTRFVYCYGGSTTNSHIAQLALNDQARPGSKPSEGITKKRVAEAVATCAAAWRAGVFSASPSAGPFAVPPLQVCLRNDLVVAVFRRGTSRAGADAFCADLGLSAP